MADGQGVDQYIDLADFTLGLHDSFHSTLSDPETPGGIKDGAARLDGTYGCYGRKGGGLYPLFNRTQTKIQTLQTPVTPLDSWRTDHSQYFSVSLEYEEFVVWPEVTAITVQAVGASGGKQEGDSESARGAGGEVVCTVTVTPGETLRVYVGEQGDTAPNTTTLTGGGWNGGGGAYRGAGTGGGATDIRRSPYALDDRLVVAAGGGGGGADPTGGSLGGHGGDSDTDGSGGESLPGLKGESAVGGDGGLGATDGTNVVGGNGSGPDADSNSGGGGGGGGWFGGGGGGAQTGDPGGGGGGGSNKGTGVNQTINTEANPLGHGFLTIRAINTSGEEYEHMQYTLGTGVLSGMIEPYSTRLATNTDQVLVLQSWLDRDGTIDSDSYYRRWYGIHVYNEFKNTMRALQKHRYGALADITRSGSSTPINIPMDLPLGSESFGLGHVVLGRSAPYSSTPIKADSAPFFAIAFGGVEANYYQYSNFPYVSILRYPGRVCSADGATPGSAMTDFYWDPSPDRFSVILQYRGRMDAMVYHQARMALGFQYYRPLGTQFHYSNDAWNYSPVNEGANWGWRSELSTNKQYIPANSSGGSAHNNGVPPDRVSNLGGLVPSSVGSVASMNASQLLIVKRHGGASIVTGDMGSPTVVDMPSVTPTHEDPNIGVATPLGYTYGSTSGVWAWAGSDSSQLLSPQFDDAFWVHDMADRAADDQPRGKFNFSHPWLFAPNGFLFNFETQSWWRLESPDAVYTIPDDTPVPLFTIVNTIIPPDEESEELPRGAFLTTFETNGSDLTIESDRVLEWAYSFYGEADDEDGRIPIVPNMENVEYGWSDGPVTPIPMVDAELTYPLIEVGDPEDPQYPWIVHAYRVSLNDEHIGVLYSAPNGGNLSACWWGWLPATGTLVDWQEIVAVDELEFGIGGEVGEGDVGSTAEYPITPPSWYELNHKGEVYAIAPYTTPSKPVLWQKYDVRSERSNYKWTSQPLVRSRARFLRTRSIILTAQGSGTVKVSWKKGTVETTAHTFTVSATEPTTYVASVGYRESDISVVIESTGTDDNTAAPIVHRLSLGYREENSLETDIG